MPNFAALRAAVFPLSTKNLRGGGYPPPPSVRGLMLFNQQETLNSSFVVAKHTSDEKRRGLENYYFLL